MFAGLCAGTDEDLEYYVRECGDILGISNKLSQDKRTAKDVLEYILFQVVEFRKLNQVQHLSYTSIYSCHYYALIHYRKLLVISILQQ